MSIRTHIPIGFAVLLLWSAIMQGQSISLGPVATGSINVPYASFPSLENQPSCCSEFGVGVGGLAAIGFEVNAYLSSDISLSLRANAGGVKDLLWTRDQIGWSMVRSANGSKVYPAYSTYYLDVSGSLLDASIIANLSLGTNSPWRVTIGTSLVSPLSLKYDQYEMIDGDESTILADSRRPQRDVSTGDITGAANSYASVNAGLRYEKPLSISTQLIYDITASIAVMPHFNSGGGSYYRNSLRASIGLLFDVYRARSSQPEPPPREEEVQEAPSPVVAETVEPINIDTVETVQIDTVFTVQTDTSAQHQILPDSVDDTTQAVPEAVVAPEEPTRSVVDPVAPEPVMKMYQLATVYPLLPYIFFLPGTDAIDTRTHATLNDESRNIDALIDTARTPSTYTKRHELINLHLLDVVGYRMTSVYPESKLVIHGYVNGRKSDSVHVNIGAKRANLLAQYLRQRWGVSSERIVAQSAERMSPTACTYALRDIRDEADAEEENTRCELESPNERRLLSSVVANVHIAENDVLSREQTNIVRIPALPFVDGRVLIEESTPSSPHTVVASIVTGFADRKGPEITNQRISEQRARKASELLHGITGKLAVDWIGEGARGMRAPYTNDSPLGRLLNRCAEVRRIWVSP